MPASDPDAEVFRSRLRELYPGLHLEPDERGIRLRLETPRLDFYHSFVTGGMARRAPQGGQALTRACGNRQRSIVTVLDLTAGWGADSLTLASQGRQVLLVEQNPILYEILQYSLSCLRSAGKGPGQTAGRMSVICANGFDYLCELESGSAFDCIYLDPMFPPHKSSAKPSADMQILQAITGNTDIERSIELSLERARKRVVVKRPARAPSLTREKPDLVVREKTVRFDVYLTA